MPRSGAPIIAVLPSKRQKEQMKLRQQAMAQGISVELTSIDDPIPEQKKYVTGTGKQLKAVLPVVAYRIVRQQDRDWRREPEALTQLVTGTPCGRGGH